MPVRAARFTLTVMSGSEQRREPAPVGRDTRERCGLHLSGGVVRVAHSARTCRQVGVGVPRGGDLRRRHECQEPASDAARP
jgi:hypothetical protein